MEAIEFMTLGDIGNALGLAGVIMFFLAPTILILFLVIGIRSYKKKRALRKQGVSTRNSKSKSFKSDKRLLKKLDEFPTEPKDKSKYSSLAMEFDETGRVVK